MTPILKSSFRYTISEGIKRFTSCRQGLECRHTLKTKIRVSTQFTDEEWVLTHLADEYSSADLNTFHLAEKDSNVDHLSDAKTRVSTHLAKKDSGVDTLCRKILDNWPTLLCLWVDTLVSTHLADEDSRSKLRSPVPFSTTVSHLPRSIISTIWFVDSNYMAAVLSTRTSSEPHLRYFSPLITYFPLSNNSTSSLQQRIALGASNAPAHGASNAPARGARNAPPMVPACFRPTHPSNHLARIPTQTPHLALLLRLSLHI